MHIITEKKETRTIFRKLVLNEKMRKRLFEIIEAGRANDIASRAYDVSMFVCIIVSIIPLMFKNESEIFTYIEYFTVTVFILDYIFRFVTADYKLGKGVKSFFIYPFTFMAIIDIFSILPSITILNEGLRLLKIFRMFRTLKVFRVFKTFRYSKNIAIIVRVFKKQKDSLIVVCGLAFAYILITALVIFNVEPDTFQDFFSAIYWATISLTTVGYGDIFAVSDIGKIITMCSSILGIAIVALPAGIITAGYMDEISHNNETKELSETEQQE